MKSATSSKTDFQIHSWAFLGPLLAIATLCVAPMIIARTPLLFSFTLLVGLYVCCTWKARGLVLALTLLVALAMYQYFRISPEEHFWFLGVYVSIALGFLVTALSFAEIESMLGEKTEVREHSQQEQLQSNVAVELQKTIQHFQEQLASAHEQIKEFEDATGEREALLMDRLRVIENLRNESRSLISKHQIDLLVVQEEQNRARIAVEKSNEQIEALQNEKNAMSVVLNNQKRELESAQKKEEERTQLFVQERELLSRKYQNELTKTHEELEQVRDEMKSLNEQITTLQNEKKSLIVSLEKQKQELLISKDKEEEWIQLHNIEIESLSHKHQKELARTREELEHIRNLIQGLNEQIGTLQSEKSILSATLDREKQKQEIAFKEHEQLMNLIKVEKESLSQELQAFTIERNQVMANLSDIERAWRCSEGRYKQLQVQFAEKSTLLDEARSHLFKSEENLLRLQHIQEELARERSKEEREMERHMMRFEKSHNILMEQYETEVSSLHELIANLNSKIPS